MLPVHIGTASTNLPTKYATEKVPCSLSSSQLELKRLVLDNRVYFEDCGTCITKIDFMNNLFANLVLSWL